MAGAGDVLVVQVVQASEFCTAGAVFAIRSANYSMMHHVFMDFEMLAL